MSPENSINVLQGHRLLTAMISIHVLHFQSFILLTPAPRFLLRGQGIEWDQRLRRGSTKRRLLLVQPILRSIYPSVVYIRNRAALSLHTSDTLVPSISKTRTSIGNHTMHPSIYQWMKSIAKDIEVEAYSTDILDRACLQQSFHSGKALRQLHNFPAAGEGSGGGNIGIFLNP